MRNRPTKFRIRMDGRRVTPTEIQHREAAARMERGQRTRVLNGTSGRPRQERRRLARAAMDESDLEREAAAMGAALRRQARAYARAQRDDDMMARQAMRALQASLRSASAGHPITVEVGRLPPSRIKWNEAAGIPASRRAGVSSWYRAADGLRTVKVNVAAVAVGNRRRRKKSAAVIDWSTGAAARFVRYAGRMNDNGAAVGDLFTNVLAGTVEAIGTERDFRRVIAFWQAAEQVELEAADPQRRHVVFKKVMVPLPAELSAADQRAIVRDLIAYFDRTGTPAFGARHEPDDPDDPNGHLHLAIGVRPFVSDGELAWSFATERNTDTLCRADIIEFRRYVAEVFNRHLEIAGLEPDFTSLSAEARGLPAPRETHRGPRRPTKKKGSRSSVVGDQVAASPKFADAEAVADPLPQAPAEAVQRDLEFADPGTQIHLGLEGQMVPTPNEPNRLTSAEPINDPNPVPAVVAGNDVRHHVEVVHSTSPAPIETAEEASPQPPVAQPPPTGVTLPRPHQVIDIADINALSGQGWPENDPKSSSADRLFAAGAKAIGGLWQRTPWGIAAKAAAEKEQAELERREQEAERLRLEHEQREAAERFAALNAYRRRQLLEILERNYLLSYRKPDDLLDPAAYSNRQDLTYVSQVLANATPEEAEAFGKAFILARSDFVRSELANEARLATTERTQIKSAGGVPGKADASEVADHSRKKESVDQSVRAHVPQAPAVQPPRPQAHPIRPRGSWDRGD